MTSPEKQDQDKKEYSKPLTREQRRRSERINAEVQSIYRALTKKYYDEFMDHPDPEGEFFAAVTKQYDAKWRLTCTRYSLVPQSYTEFKKFSDDILKSYKENLE